MKNKYLYWMKSLRRSVVLTDTEINNLKNILIGLLLCGIICFISYKFGYKNGSKNQFIKTMNKIYQNPIPLINDLIKKGVIKNAK